MRRGRATHRTSSSGSGGGGLSFFALGFLLPLLAFVEGGSPAAPAAAVASLPPSASATDTLAFSAGEVSSSSSARRGEGRAAYRGERVSARVCASAARRFSAVPARCAVRPGPARRQGAAGGSAARGGSAWLAGEAACVGTRVTKEESEFEEAWSRRRMKICAPQGNPAEHQCESKNRRGQARRRRARYYRGWHCTRGRAFLSIMLPLWAQQEPRMMRKIF